MLAKFPVTFLALAGMSFLVSNCSAQTAQKHNTQWTSPKKIPVSPAAFGSFGSQDEDAGEGDDAEAALVALTEKLSKQVERLELRIRELEDDVETKLDDAGEGNSEAFEEQTEEFEERFEEIEENLEAHGEAIEDVSGTIPGLVHHSHKSPKLQFFGRIHLDYWAYPQFDGTLAPLEDFDDPQDQVTFRRLRIGVKGDLNDNVFYKYEGEFAGGINPSYRDAFIGFKDVPFLQTVIIGNHKRPYGLDHLNSSRHNVFIERPFIVEAFNQDSRRLGISFNGISNDKNWNWRYGIWNQELTQNGPGWFGDNYQLEAAARIAGTPWYDESSGGRGYLHVALSGSAGVLDPNLEENSAAQFRTRPEARTANRWLNTGFIPGAEETTILGLESALNLGAFHINGEYMRAGVGRVGTGNLDFDGGYVQASYLWTGEHHPWNRKTGTLGRLKPFENFFRVRDLDGATKKGWGAWETALRFSWADLSDADVLGGEGYSWTLGLNWYWNPYARMQFNYINGNVSNNEIGDDNGIGGFGDYQVLGARIMVDF